MHSNLLPKGKITVRLRNVDNRAELSVQDTGVGIPEAEMPRLFERFHRVEGTQGRTHEGTGIGLALVQELVKMHHGTIQAHSELGKGSQFVVSIPLGSSHLPKEQIAARTNSTSNNVTTQAYAQESLAWLREDGPPPPDDVSPSKAIHMDFAPSGLQFGIQPLILLAEDNGDMRNYLRRVLSDQGYEVEAVPDGLAALEAARRRRPDLILTDVMMPRMDGESLLRAIREDSTLSSIPVILLSARAGEDFRIQGLGSGADDYLVKPFSARELLARVKSHVDSTQRRGESENRLRLALELGRMGNWERNLRNGEVFWSANQFTLLGYQPAECVPSLEAWERRVHPDDLAGVKARWEAAKQSHEDYGVEYRLILPDGRRFVGSR